MRMCVGCFKTLAYNVILELAVKTVRFGNRILRAAEQSALSGCSGLCRHRAN